MPNSPLMHSPLRAQHLTANPSISVIVPAHLGGETLERTLKALSGASPAPDEIIVVADGGHPDVLEAALKYGFSTISLPESCGPAAARNAGSVAAKSEILFFIDSDVEVKTESIALVTEFFAANDSIHAMIGSYDDEPPMEKTVSWFRNILHHHTHQTGPSVISSFWSGCGAIRRETFLNVGGFDENFDLPSIEDIDLGYRLYKQGFRVSVVKTLMVKHLKEWSFSNMVVTDIFRRAKPWVQLMRSNSHFPTELNINKRGRLNAILAATLGPTSLILMVNPSLWPIPLLVLLSLVINNKSFYTLLFVKGGLVKGFAGIVLHWIHLMCALLGGTLGLLTPKPRNVMAKSRHINLSPEKV